MVRWLAGTAGIAIGVAALILSSPADTARAASPFMTECTGCHLAKVPIEGITRPELLKGHDKLGLANDACMVCHDRENKHLGILSLNDGTQISFKDSSQLCAQCHEKRYKAWQIGTHGVPAWKAGEIGFPGGEKKTCVDCHDPHSPQIALLSLTKQHPAPAPPPPSFPPGLQLGVLGAAMLIAVGGGTAVVLTRKVR
ncbi:MAG: hypothetical protein Q7J73_06635 [Dehalococcoidales bacterium]|nr:hypothetical protein [Dehalococcoidales bacterium]